ncbi:Atu4866 domain-containing protein [Streptomyces hirsutus]|uniref:Atu4866 domain-containing protein n=1 Tax=Streptomyces hirsutus TaxID=35620 RepID=A0ABZ1GVU0_9ACTN|nr:Atu4866 domain-containing protein [Streptomyces hirsutus]WSD09437.1 Atu4866 domain-containing protein [Streptomyces hirsutus]WTD17112.1 Atu4866 domain-containing protein [Streptomyces hirsutus]
MTIVPAVVDTVALVGGRGKRSEHVATLTPGTTNDLLMVPDELAADVPSALATLMSRPEQVRALVAADRPVLWGGSDAPGRATAPGVGIPASPDLTGSPRVGIWIDQEDFLHQELTADGCYDETRGGQPHAYQGRYWIDGGRIDYLVAGLALGLLDLFPSGGRQQHGPLRLWSTSPPEQQCPTPRRARSLMRHEKQRQAAQRLQPTVRPETVGLVAQPFRATT